MVGRTLAHYEILEKLGSGGMGDVYLPEDEKLDRKIALKVLPPELAESDDRRARFQREAKAVAAGKLLCNGRLSARKRAGYFSFLSDEERNRMERLWEGWLPGLDSNQQPTD